MLSLLDAQGAVGFGDQPVAADQTLAALRKPVEHQGGCDPLESAGPPPRWCRGRSSLGQRYQRSAVRHCSITAPRVQER